MESLGSDIPIPELAQAAIMVKRKSLKGRVPGEKRRSFLHCLSERRTPQRSKGQFFRGYYRTQRRLPDKDGISDGASPMQGFQVRQTIQKLTVNTVVACYESHQR